MDTKLTWYGEEVTAELNKELAERLEVASMAIQSEAQMLCPVDTGTLTLSIDHLVLPEELEGWIGTDVEYAAYVEFGTRKSPAQPYLRPAAQTIGTEQFFKNLLKKA